MTPEGMDVTVISDALTLIAGVDEAALAAVIASAFVSATMLNCSTMVVLRVTVKLAISCFFCTLH